ncbi:MAG: dUTPase [Calditrichae bacterium]|nr:dUTPase [Calditrichia bacterium]
MDILKVIFEKQHELNKRILKERHDMDYDELCDHAKQNPDLEKKRVEWLLHYNRAQIHESIELEDSVPWKWWKDPSPVDWQNISIELIDELHFWVSKCQIAGLDVEKLQDLYIQKNKLNQLRQDKGYGSTYQKVDENGVEDNKRMKELLDE